MPMGIIGRKVGMTQIFGPEGDRFAVTIVEATPNTVVGVKRADGPDGYDALVLGFEGIKDKHLSKPQAGMFSKRGLTPRRHLREARVTGTEAALFEVGGEITVSQFHVGQFVDVVGTTKGHGFTGVIKRHGFSQPKMSHGTHEVFRHGGSLGSNTTPGRVWKGKKMAGHDGNSRVTVQNLMIVAVDPERNMIAIKGGLPGPNGRLVWVQKASRVG